MKYSIVLGATLLAGCATSTGLRIGTENLTDAMRIEISQKSFESSVRVNRLAGKPLYLKYVTFHADSLYYACAEFASAKEPVDGSRIRRSCRRAMPTDRGGVLALSEITALGIVEQDPVVLRLFLGLPTY